MGEHMALGDDIGGFKYINPNRLELNDKNIILDDGSEQRKDYAGSALDNDALRFVTKLTGTATQILLVHISEVLNKTLEEEKNSGKNKFSKWEELRIKLEELYLENRDLGKSLVRGWHDLLSRNIPKTAFENRIKSELLEPVREYIQNEALLPQEKSEELVNRIAKIHKHWFTPYTGRG